MDRLGFPLRAAALFGRKIVIAANRTGGRCVVHSFLATSSAVPNWVSTPFAKLWSVLDIHVGFHSRAFYTLSLPGIPASDRYAEHISTGQFEIGASEYLAR